jgi:hypothetical protein
MQFTFYNRQGKSNSFIFVTLKQNYTLYIIFDNRIASYSKFNLSIIASENLLDIRNFEDK